MKRWIPKEKICIICNSTYIQTGKNQKYCSISCQNKASNQRKKENYDPIKKQLWYQKNKETIYKKKKKYIYDKRKNDIKWRLKSNLRCRIKRAINGNYKSGSAIESLGCSIYEFKVYLEKLFQPGMSWDNYGRDGWHIDHIKPLSLFDLTDPKQLKEACYYTNLQPLWQYDNLKKGNNYHERNNL